MTFAGCIVDTTPGCSLLAYSQKVNNQVGPQVQASNVQQRMPVNIVLVDFFEKSDPLTLHPVPDRHQPAAHRGPFSIAERLRIRGVDAAESLGCGRRLAQPERVGLSRCCGQASDKKSRSSSFGSRSESGSDMHWRSPRHDRESRTVQRAGGRRQLRYQVAAVAPSSSIRMTPPS